MFLKSLKLQNIRSYVEETVQFPQGSVLLAGDIGAGKSTILLAIEFALFGAKRGELGASSLLRNGAHAGLIELTLELQGKNVSISRTLKRTPTAVKQDAGHIVLGETRQDATTTELRAKMIELLGYPKDALTKKDLLYRYTVFTPQEEMRKILYDDTEARLNTLRKVFHIDKYKRMKVNAQLIAKEMKSQSRALGETVSGVMELQQKHKELTEKSGVMDVQCNKEKPALFALQEKRVIVEKEISIIEMKKKEIEELRKKDAVCVMETQQLLERGRQLDLKISVITEEITVLDTKTKDVLVCPSTENKEALQSQIDLLRKEIQETKEQQVKLLQKKQGLEEKHKYIKEELVQLAEAVEHKKSYEEQIVVLDTILDGRKEVTAKIAEQDERLLGLTKKLVACDVQSKQAQTIVDRIGTMEKCTLCLQNVVHEHKQKILVTQRTAIAGAGALTMQLHQQKEEVMKILDEWKRKEKEILIAEKKRAVVQNVLHSVLEKEAQKIEKEKLLVVVQNEIEAILAQAILTKDIGSQEKEVIRYKELLDKLFSWEKADLERKNVVLMLEDKERQKKECMVEKDGINKKRLELNEIKLALVEQMKQYGALDETYLDAKRKLQFALDEEKKQEILIVGLEKEITHLKEQIGFVVAEIAVKKEVQMKVTKLKVYSSWLEDFFVPLVGTMEKQVMLQVHASFSSFFTSWFAMLMEDDGMHARLSEEFSPVIEQNGYETTLTDLSGGEKTAVALAYRLALNKVINDFVQGIHTKDLIILDEPTDGFSAQQLDKVREVLDQLGMSQVIIVSHESKIESFVEHVLRIEKTEHVSRVL